MAFTSSLDTTWCLFTLPSIVGTHNVFNNGPFICSIFTILVLVTWLVSPGGLAWKNGRTKLGRVPIPGPRGLPFFGSLLSLSHGLPHRTLACMASSRAMQLMAFSLGSTPVVVSSDPRTAREILTSPHFANRPIKQSAKDLMFSRAIGFAPDGSYWRLLRRVSSSHLFAPKRIAAHEAGRQLDCSAMVCSVGKEQSLCGFVVLRKHLQSAALENMMGTVFGKRYGAMSHTEEARELNELVREGFDLLGAFNLSDYLPWIGYVYDPFRIKSRCLSLVPRVRKLVKRIIDEHRLGESKKLSDDSDFVDVLLSLDGDDKLREDDMIAVLWEMIFRGTDTTALLTEWVMAELVLNSEVQDKLYHELNNVVGDKRDVTDADVARMPYLQAVVKETLRLHPPGPLLSWARLSTSDVQLSNGMVIPANTTAMVNMWAITHDPAIWEEPMAFKPERYLSCSGGSDVDVRGRDLRLAPFGAGRRVCPGKNLGLATVSLWVARLVHRFKWVEDMVNPVDLSEVLKLSCEMKTPLSAVVTPRPGNWV